MCVCSSSFVLAHAILDSLALLASLRPRSSADDVPSLVPPPAVLHKLHRSLATEATPGWYGTLPPARSTALRDDATVKVRPGAATASTAATSAAGGSQPAAPSAANTFGAYGYSYGRAQPAAAYTPYKPGQAPPAGSRATDEAGARTISRFMNDETLAKVEKLGQLAAEAGLTLPEMALAWVLRQPGVSSAIVGASRPEQVDDNVAAADIVLDDDLVARMDAILEPVVLR